MFTGAVYKSKDIIGWKDASVAETNQLNGAYFIKVDGHETISGKKAQIQIWFEEMDAAAIVANFEKFLNKTDGGKRHLNQEREMIK